MAENINVRDFLHGLLANKSKTKISIEEFDSLLDMARRIQKFSQKGLFIATLAQQLQKMSTVNYYSIKKCMNQFFSSLKPEKPRREREPGEHRRRRRPHPTEAPNAARQLQRMVEQSTSNPSNIQLGRMGTQGLSNRENQSVKLSEDISKRSGDFNKKDLEFAHELNKISQNMLELQHTGLNDFPHHEEHFQQFSKNSSSASSFGVISNLSQKMGLLQRHGRRDGEKKTKVQKNQRPTEVEMTMTKKKNQKAIIVDEMLTLQKTKATFDQSYNTQQSMNHEYFPWLDQYDAQNSLYESTFEEYLSVLKQNPLSSLNNVTLSARKRDQRETFQDNFGIADFQHDATFQEAQRYDFTTQYDGVESGGQIQIGELSIFAYDESNPTLGEVSSRVNKPEAAVFYEMLAKMQKGEVELTQQSIGEFSEIRVQLLAQSQ